MRRHSTRDITIFYVSYYAGLRAKEIAALTVGDVYDEHGSVREQFVLDAVKPKAQRHAQYG
jgi:integrase/recombinase XerD